MIERICDELEVPLRHRNRLYLAAGYAPVHPERPFVDLGAAKEAVRAVLGGLEPNPAVAVNVHWDVLAVNDAMHAFLEGLPVELARPPLNILRATLHPDGLAGQVSNLAAWRAHVLRRVRRQLERTSAEGLRALLTELASYPAGGTAAVASGAAGAELVVPLQLNTTYGTLSLLYSTTVFGSSKDVTLDELAIETFFPADAATARVLRALADARTCEPRHVAESG